MRKFFFDTANYDFIKKTTEYLTQYIDPKLILGTTTNPNAFFKIGKNKLSEWFDETKRLCELFTEIRQDDKGVVYIQCPYSWMNSDAVLKYAEVVSKLSDGYTKIGLKIPPYENILRHVVDINNFVETNVTGISDAATALKSLTYPVKYISVIPGRMDEVGIDYIDNIVFIQQANLENKEIISGSMRTVEQVIDMFKLNTVPTIGERVFNDIIDNNKIDQILKINYEQFFNHSEFSPIIDEKNLHLSELFFNQMDELGSIAYNDFILNSFIMESI